ncbi:MAG: amidohydrolase family protein [Oscillospiraceae bacterium]|nr:amidohydrolase family protein [Oscillospiraceae bacterium]
MRADCHIHMVLDGADWRRAIDSHRIQPDRELICARLKAYADAGFTYLRDGGDKWGVGAAARALALEWGITYRTPLAPLICAGHYGGFIGEKYENLREYAALVKKRREQGADFIKIMISGIMDFDRFGVLSEPGLPPEMTRELVHIAHAEGFAVMAHCNGARTAEAAAEAGAESIEHGAYLDDDALHAMRENGTVWVPTLSAIGNLRGRGRFDERAVAAIYESDLDNIRRFVKMNGLIAPGSDAGAWAVPHIRGGMDEYVYLADALGRGWRDIINAGIDAVRTKF